MKYKKSMNLIVLSLAVLIIFSGCSLLLPSYLFENESSYEVEVDIVGEEPFTIDSGDDYRHYSFEPSLQFYYSPTDTVTMDRGIGVVTFMDK